MLFRSAVHGDVKLGGVSVLFSSDLQVATLHQNVVGVECSHVVGVSIRREDQRSLYAEEGKNGCAVYIHEEMQTLRNADSFSCLRRQVVAPGLSIRPATDVAVNLALGCNKTLAVDVDLELGCVCDVRLVHSGTDNGGSALGSDGTSSVVDGDSGSGGVREISSIECN